MSGSCALVRLALIAALVAGGAASEADDAVPLVEPPPRAFGHVLGDVLVQRLNLDAERLTPALAASVPEGRIGPWFERLPARIAEGTGGRRVLEIAYQVVNVPEAPRATVLPGLVLGGELGSEASRAESGLPDAGAVTIEPWPLVIGPLVPIDASGAGTPPLQPDRRLPPVDEAPYRTRRNLAALALGTTLVLWLGWWTWRGRRERVRLPFAEAAYRIGALPSPTRDEDPAAWRALHAALNRAAGRTAGPVALDALLARHPWLGASRERLEAFYAASADRFFATPPRPRPFPLAALARELGRAERRHAR